MKDVQLKGLMNLVVRTANDLAKHHSDETLEIVSDEIASESGRVRKKLKVVAADVKRIDADQTQAY